MSNRSRKPINVTYFRPFLFWYQVQFIDNPERFTIVEACTKVGKTVAMIVWLLEQALNGKTGQQYWWIAPIRAQSKIAYDRLKRYIPIPGFFVPNETNLTLTLPNGAVIAFKSAENDDTLYGDDVYAAVFDEASRAREKAWYAIRSTLTSTGGKCKFIANVRGRGWYYKLAQKAKNGSDPEYAYFKVTAWDAVMTGGLLPDEVKRRRKDIVGHSDKKEDIQRGEAIYDKLLNYAYAPMREKDTKRRLSLSEVLQAKRDLPDHIFRELYEAEPSDDGGNPFGVQYLDAAKRQGLAPGPPVCMGIDLAETTDFTVENGLNTAGDVCHHDRYQKDWPTTKAQVIALPDIPTAIDQTGVGKPVVEDAQKVKKNIEGFTFTSSSKQQLIEGLAAAIKQGLTHFPADSVLEDELYSFEYEYTRTGIRYRAPVGLHDDCVCAYALAWHKFRYRPAAITGNVRGSAARPRDKFWG